MVSGWLVYHWGARGKKRSTGSQDDVDPTVGVDNIADLTHLEGKSSFFEGLLHLSPPESACESSTGNI